MMHLRTVSVAVVLSGLFWLPIPVLAQTDQEAVPLIMLKPQGAGFSAPRLRKFYASLKKRAGKATSQILPLTKAEVWSVPKEKVDAVRRSAARHGVTMSQLGATWRQIFHKAPANMKMSDKQNSMMGLAKASKAVMGVGVMMAPSPPIVEYALTKDANDPSASEAQKITVVLNESTSLSITRTSVDIKSDMCTWRGTVDGTGAPAVLMWWPGGKMTGTVQHEGRLYSIRHMGGEMQAVVEMGENLMPQEHASMPQPLRANDPNLRDDPLVQQGDASTLRPQAAPTSNSKAAAIDAGRSAKAPTVDTSAADITIDVIVAYTRKAASNYSDIKRELVDLSIEEGNESFRQSGIGQVKLRLVHAYQTDYVEEGAHFDHVWRFADKGDGYMDEIHGLRDKYKADVAVLIVDDPQGCGLATRVFADADEAFAVVHHECAATSYSLAHEVGHLIGARHDLNLDKIMKPFPYGHGYVSGTKWRDIMSYKESCGGCPRLPVWSSPLVKVKGEPAGTAELDNARVILEQAARVAAFR